MNWESMLMPALVGGGLLLGLVGTWATLKLKSDQHGKRIDELEQRSEDAEDSLRTRAEVAEVALRTRADAVAAELATYKLHVSEAFVRKDDLRQVEDRLAKRIDTVENTVRTATTQIISAITDPRPRPRGRAE